MLFVCFIVNKLTVKMDTFTLYVSLLTIKQTLSILNIENHGKETFDILA